MEGFLKKNEGEKRGQKEGERETERGGD